MPSIVSGFPARPIATTRPSAIADAGRRTPSSGSASSTPVDRDLDPAALGAHAEAVAHRVAEARQEPIRAAGLVDLGHEPQVGVAEPDALRHPDTPARARSASAASRAPG